MGGLLLSHFHHKESLSMSIGAGGPGGLLGGGGYFNPQGPGGPWMGCGCSSIFIMLAGVLLVFGGCLRMIGQ
jgi:hypothetical protein